MTLSNKLTLSRFFMAGIFMWFLVLPGWVMKSAALGVFVIATITDWLDGAIARRRNEVTRLGSFLDPLADKVLVLGAFWMFAKMGWLALWMVVVVVVREVLITSLRFYAVSRGMVIPAGRAGKLKTVAQFICIISVLLIIIVEEVMIGHGVAVSYQAAHFMRLAILIVMFITVFLTVASGILYLWRYRELVHEK